MSHTDCGKVRSAGRGPWFPPFGSAQGRLFRKSRKVGQPQSGWSLRSEIKGGPAPPSLSRVDAGTRKSKVAQPPI